MSTAPSNVPPPSAPYGPPPQGQHPGQFGGQYSNHPAPPNGQPPYGSYGHPQSARPIAALPILAGIAAVLLVAIGLSIPFDSSSAWATQLAWSIFAMLAVLLAQAAIMTGQNVSNTTWKVGAAGAAALVAYWALIVLPGVTSNAGFVLTLGTAAAAAGCWFSPSRPR